MTNLLAHDYNPDVLSCIANLSNDEVFTPPALANRVLDMLPKELWGDPDVKILDPFCKSGIFLREAAKRFIKGLELVYPDLQERVDHIMHEQLYGIAVTELTSFLSRRSLYCSKYPNGIFSISQFEDAEGNVRFRNIPHTWVNGRCKYCGASEKEYKRSRDLETYAYEFIHTDAPERILNMKFDVIVGNPPYQLSDGGNNASAIPLYQKFVQQAKKLNPRYLSMITPSRWFSGGRGLDEFRKEMLHDRRIKRLVDFENADECFPGVDMSGGVSYFLWERDYDGDCTIVNVAGNVENETVRDLGKYDILIRSNKAIPIVDKVFDSGLQCLESDVSSQRPFGLRTFVQPEKTGDLVLRWRGGRGPILRERVTTGLDMIDKWKVIVSRVVYEHAGGTDAQGMRRVLSVLELLAPGEVCTETYIVVRSFDNEEEALNCLWYLSLKLPRFLIAQVASAQMVNKKSFAFVPVMDFTHRWTDEELYERFQLSAEERQHVEKSIKSMPAGEPNE